MFGEGVDDIGKGFSPSSKDCSGPTTFGPSTEGVDVCDGDTDEESLGIKVVEWEMDEEGEMGGVEDNEIVDVVVLAGDCVGVVVSLSVREGEEVDVGVGVCVFVEVVDLLGEGEELDVDVGVGVDVCVEEDVRV